MRKLIYFLILVTNYVFGQKNNFNDNLFGFATSNTFTYCDIDDSLFINKVNKLNPKILRFPGGAVGNFYHFGKSGYGFDFDEIEMYDAGRFRERSRALDRAKRMKGHSHDYIDDFISLAKITEAKAILVANMFVDNDDILLMINKIKNAGIDIIGVELGSELSNRTFYQKGYTIDDYIIDAQRISNKIKNQFPNLRTAVVAAPISSKKNRRHSIWNEKLSEMDFYDDIIVHSYAKVIKGKKEFGQMISYEKEGKNEKEAFEIYRKRALEFLNTGFENEINTYQQIFKKPIWITEWNLQISKVTSNTMFQSMYVCNYFLELFSNNNLSAIDLSTYHNMGGRDFGGSIFRNNNEVIEIQSPYIPLTFIGIFIDNSKYVVKEQLLPMVYEYKAFDKKNKHVFSILINWKSEYYEFLATNCISASSFYSDELYDKANISGELKILLNEKKEAKYIFPAHSVSLIKY